MIPPVFVRTDLSKLGSSNQRCRRRENSSQFASVAHRVVPLGVGEFLNASGLDHAQGIVHG